MVGSKRVCAAERGEAGRNRREGWKNTWEIGRCLFRVNSELVHAQAEKIAKSFGSGAGFLFVQTRHAQSPKITGHSTQPEPSVARTRAVAEKRQGVFIKGRSRAANQMPQILQKEDPRVPGGGEAQKSVLLIRSTSGR